MNRMKSSLRCLEIWQILENYLDTNLRNIGSVPRVGSPKSKPTQKGLLTSCIIPYYVMNGKNEGGRLRPFVRRNNLIHLGDPSYSKSTFCIETRLKGG